VSGCGIDERKHVFDTAGTARGDGSKDKETEGQEDRDEKGVYNTEEGIVSEKGQGKCTLRLQIQWPEKESPILIRHLYPSVAVRGPEYGKPRMIFCPGNMRTYFAGSEDLR